MELEQSKVVLGPTEEFRELQRFDGSSDRQCPDK